MTTLELLMLARDYVQDQEGEVITFSDGQMAKIKNVKYLELHGLIGPDAFRENLLVQTIINGNIDDVISNLVQGPKKDMIVDIEEKVSKQFNLLCIHFGMLRENYFKKYKENRKDFAMANSKQPMFSGVMKSLNELEITEKFVELKVKEYISKQCNSLGKSKEWLASL